jgi:hypothetical protein
LDFHEVVQQYVSSPGMQLGAPERALLRAVGDALIEADRPPYCAPQVRQYPSVNSRMARFVGGGRK